MVLDALVDDLRALAGDFPADLVAAYLYGSRARGTANGESDVDLGILLSRSPEPKLRNRARFVEDGVERALGLATEVVVLNDAGCDLVHRVLRDGIIVLDRDRAARIRFEVRARNEYFDMEPIRRLYRRLPA